MEKVFTWNEIVKEIMPQGSFGENPSNKNWCSVITFARKFGIGEPISFQKTSYSPAEVGMLKKILAWWEYLGEFSNVEFRDNLMTREMLRCVISSLKSEKPVKIYAVFCPSYATGKGVVGYTGKVGPRTKSSISSMVSFLERSNDLGIKMEGVAYFSDLLLENYEKLQGTDYKKDLESNFREFEDILIQSRFITEVKKLSEIKDLEKEIGERGIEPADLKEDSGKLFECIYKRNIPFYEEELGWGDEEIRQRTKTLIGSYRILGRFFKNLFPDGLMFWTESAYERGLMYNAGLDKENVIPIIYPRK